MSDILVMFLVNVSSFDLVSKQHYILHFDSSVSKTKTSKTKTDRTCNKTQSVRPRPLSGRKIYCTVMQYSFQCLFQQVEDEDLI